MTDWSTRGDRCPGCGAADLVCVTTYHNREGCWLECRACGAESPKARTTWDANDRNFNYFTDEEHAP